MYFIRASSHTLTDRLCLIKSARLHVQQFAIGCFQHHWHAKHPSSTRPLLLLSWQVGWLIAQQLWNRRSTGDAQHAAAAHSRWQLSFLGSALSVGTVQAYVEAAL